MTTINDPTVAVAMAEIPALQARLHFLGPRDQQFASSLISDAKKRGFLTRGQAPWIHDLIDRTNRNEQPTEPERAVSIGDVSGIKALFDRARCHLKAPGVVMSVPGVGVVKVSVQKENARRFAGKTVVQDYDKPYPHFQTYGVINDQGGFEPKKGVTIPDSLIPTLQSFAKDPVPYAAAYGRMTGRCCFCRNRLTDPRSTAQGWGPDCAENFGLPWGERPEAGNVFLASDASQQDQGEIDLTGFEIATGNECKQDD